MQISERVTVLLPCGDTAAQEVHESEQDKGHKDCAATTLTYGPRLIRDILDRTETAMTQAHCFLATELALTAEAKATRLAGAAS